MNRPLACACLALTLLFASSPAPAQDEPAASHLAAARELLDAVGGEDYVAMSSSMVLVAMMEADPEMAQFEDVIEKWLTEVVDWDEVMSGIAAIYTESFSEAEMREITAFYRTPLGQKCVNELPALMERGGELGEELMMAHAPQLETMIMERLAEMEAAGGTAEGAGPDKEE